MSRSIRIGSRKSALAVVQARIVMDRIRSAYPELELELVPMSTTGDRILDRTLEQAGGKGLFVKELDQALRDGRIDLAVHSLKDVPMELPEDLPILACSARADARDVLILPRGGADLNRGLPFGCSSARRRLQLNRLFPGMDVKPVRGNVLTRLKKLDSGGFAALVLAYAGVSRLGLSGRISRAFSAEEMIPAAGQGILAVQGRAGADFPFLSCVEDKDARRAAQAERAFVRALGGGCTAPTAAYAKVEGGTLVLTGVYFGRAGEICRRGALSGPAERAGQIGKELAERLREKT